MRAGKITVSIPERQAEGRLMANTVLQRGLSPQRPTATSGMRLEAGSSPGSIPRAERLFAKCVII